MITCTTNYQLIIRQLYKFGADGILCKFVFEHELDALCMKHMRGFMEDTMKGRKYIEICCKTYFGGLHYAKEYCKRGDVCHRVGKPLRHD